MSHGALIVIDVQRGFDDAVWGNRDNPACEANVARLVASWRRRNQPIVFVRHDSVEPASPLRPGQPGNDFKPVLTGEPSLIVSKTVHSAFHGNVDLHDWLSARNVASVAICGIQTNQCCETTARVACDLGYRVAFVLDATHTFDRRSHDGSMVSAEMLAQVTATNLHDEFAQVVRTADLI